MTSTTDVSPPGTVPTQRLRNWLAVTILAVLGIVAAVPAVLFGTMMGGFAADDPNASADTATKLILAVWVGGLGYVLLLVAGAAGGWLAFRAGRARLSFGLSLLAAAPILLALLAVIALVLFNFLWTASFFARGPL
jgi:hypothetical protein